MADTLIRIFTNKIEKVKPRLVLFIINYFLYYSMVSFRNLPDEILVMVLSQCDVKTTLALRWSWSRWLAISSSDGWKCVRFGIAYNERNYGSQDDKDRTARQFEMLLAASTMWRERISRGMCIPRVFRGSALLIDACRLGLESLTTLLLADGGVLGSYAAASQACGRGHVNIVRLLLAHHSYQRLEIQSDLLLIACEHSQPDIVQILLATGQVDPSIRDNNAIRRACVYGNLSIVRALLADARVDPSVDECAPFFSACKGGHADVVALLLQDERVDPTMRAQWAIRDSSRRGNTAVVRVLLSDPRVDPGSGGFDAVRQAVGEGRVETVRVLLADERMQPVARDTSMNSLLCIACTRNLSEMTRALLECPSIDPSADMSRALREACTMGHTEVVRVLLEDDRAQVSACVDYALNFARANHRRNSELIQLLEEAQDKVRRPTRLRNRELDRLLYK